VTPRWLLPPLVIWLPLPPQESINGFVFLCTILSMAASSSSTSSGPARCCPATPLHHLPPLVPHRPLPSNSSIAEKVTRAPPPSMPPNPNIDHGRRRLALSTSPPAPPPVVHRRCPSDFDTVTDSDNDDELEHRDRGREGYVLWVGPVTR
jgi:hypothetical protein